MKDVFRLFEYDSSSNTILINRNTVWSKSGNSQKLIFDSNELYINETSIVSIRFTADYADALSMCAILGSQLISEKDIGQLKETGYPTCNEDVDAISWLLSSSNSASNGAQISYCNQIKNDWNIKNVSCVKKNSCNICKIILSKFTLYGHEGTHFDYIYFIEIKDGKRLSWRGERGSYIEKRGNSWILFSKFHNVEWILPDTELPVGRKLWKISERVNKNSSVLLSLSTCKTFEFACDNGECINIVNRCDEKYHCKDESDENECQVLYVPLNYNPNNLPPARPQDDLPIPIEFNVIVNNLEKITSSEGIATIDVGITMMWYDSRVSFRNLIPNHRHYIPCEYLWLPSIRASSGITSRSIVPSETYLSMCYVFLEKKRQEHVKRSLWDPMMGKYYFIIFFNVAINLIYV